VTPPAKEPYSVPDYEILAAVLSVRMWQRLYGPVTLYTDRTGAEQYERLGLVRLYDEIDSDCLGEIDCTRVDPSVHWAAAKIFACRAERLPFALMDTDFILFRRIPNLTKYDFVFAHWERPEGHVYPPRARIAHTDGLDYDAWDWSTYACNMGFAYFAHARHRESFTSKAIRFLEQHSDSEPGSFHCVHQVFAEQRIVAFEGRRLGIRMKPILRWVFDPSAAWEQNWANSRFHHTWNWKSRFGECPELRREFCSRYLLEILQRFPGELERLMRIPQLRSHINQLVWRSAVAQSGPWTNAWTIPGLFRFPANGRARTRV
jgi:hypothetical protein